MTAVVPVKTVADLVPIPWPRLRTTALVVAFALLTAAAARLSFYLPWTPVPVTGQTFAVLLSGAALGLRRGAASQLLYVALGAVGLPFYAGGEGGWAAATGSTAGYLAGFVVAAAVVGALAERRQDRSMLTSLPAMLAGTAVIYVCGAVWLAHSLDVSGAVAVELGVAPFLIGDAVKMAAAGVLFPVVWKMLPRTDSSEQVRPREPRP